MRIPEKLVSAIRQGSASAFVGAGMSMPVTRKDGRPLPSWKGLLQELKQFAESEASEPLPYSTEIDQAIAKDDLMVVAQQLEESLTTHQKAKFFSAVFEDGNLQPTEDHHLLVGIPFRGFLTTNYDALIELAIAKQGNSQPSVFIPGDLDHIPNPLRHDETWIFKLHGDANRPESIVLDSHDYQTTIFRRPGYRAFLETLLTVHTILFMGFSMADPDIENLIENLASIYSRHNDVHYALVPRGFYNSLEKHRLEQDKRIELIEFDNPDGKYGEVTTFLRRLHAETHPETKLN